MLLALDVGNTDNVLGPYSRAPGLLAIEVEK
jgi:hypothetical protein